MGGIYRSGLGVEAYQLAVLIGADILEATLARWLAELGLVHYATTEGPDAARSGTWLLEPRHN